MVDNPVFVPDELQDGYSALKPAKRDQRRQSRQQQQQQQQQLRPRMSQYFILTTASHSSSGSSNSPSIPAHNLYHAPANYYYPPPDYPIPSSAAMWHRNRYQEEELPSMYAGPFPMMQVTQDGKVPPVRRYSGAATSSESYVEQPQQQQHQRRKISVTKYQNIPECNYLQVPSFHDYELKSTYAGTYTAQRRNASPNHNYQASAESVHLPSTSRKFSNPPSSRRISTNSTPKSSVSSHTKRSQSQPQERRTSRSPLYEDKAPASAAGARPRSPSLDIVRVPTPDPTSVPVPAFEFNSSHLPLRASIETMHKFLSASGSTSTPESQRLESRQMIRPSSSKNGCSPKVELLKDCKKEAGSCKAASQADKSIFAITKPAQWCRHNDGKTCQSCSPKDDTRSVCSSVNPPPTFTLDAYQPQRKRTPRCSCTCGAIFSISVTVAVMVMLFVAAFILYVEMVLKYQTADVTEKM